MGRVNNKVALITGGASGVGKETVELLLKEGAYVAFGDIDVQGGEDLAKACGERALFLRHDVSNEAEWQQVIAKVQSHFGPLDILINNASRPPHWRSFDSSCRSMPILVSWAASKALRP